MPRILFVKEEKIVECEAGANLRKVCLDNGIDLYEFPRNLPLANCMGRGICGTCRVKVESNDGLTTATRAERLHLGSDDPTMRLACCCSVTGDIELTSQPRSLGWHDHAYYVESRTSPRA